MELPAQFNSPNSELDGVTLMRPAAPVPQSVGRSFALWCPQWHTVYFSTFASKFQSSSSISSSSRSLFFRQQHREWSVQWLFINATWKVQATFPFLSSSVIHVSCAALIFILQIGGRSSNSSKLLSMFVCALIAEWLTDWNCRSLANCKFLQVPKGRKKWKRALSFYYV